MTGQRALIWFTPSISSTERMIAGAVVRLSDGTVKSRSAIDVRKARFAFGFAGEALHAATQALCKSAEAHWTASRTIRDWAPPFAHAGLAEVTKITAADADSALDFALFQQSALQGMLDEFTLPSQQNERLIERVRRFWKQSPRTNVLTRGLSREADFGPGGVLKVDFWGSQFACYFTALSDGEKQREISVQRALGKLVQLQALQTLNQKHLDWRASGSIGLFDERPSQLQLIVVGQKPSKAMYALEQLADKKEVLIRQFTRAEDAAGHVADSELAAA